MSSLQSQFKSMLKTTILLAASVLGFSQTANATVIFEDDFETNNFNSVWNLTGGGIDRGDWADLCGGGNFCIDTEGTGPNTNASFYTSLGGLAAGSYSFSFDWANNSGLGHTADYANFLDWDIMDGVSSLYNGTIASGAATTNVFTTFSFDFTLVSAISDARIAFAQTGAGNDWGGTLLDNVSLVKNNVPEPESFVLLALGLLGLSLRKKLAA